MRHIITTTLVEIVAFNTDLLRAFVPRHSCPACHKICLGTIGRGRTAVSIDRRHALIDLILHGIAALCKGTNPKVRINLNAEEIFTLSVSVGSLHAQAGPVGYEGGNGRYKSETPDQVIDYNTIYHRSGN